ncbi:MAG: tetratricopeptide repeat protein [Muribaculaceae bacterium]|nr:tetratricopeptide repeat protein [Muribaculaceae bacterium]
MSKKIQETTETGLDGLNDSLTAMTAKVQDNKKIIMVCSLVVVAIAAIVLAYVYFFRNPGIQKQNDQIGAADLELAQGNDSTAMVQYMALADNGSYDAANRAALQSAILLYQDGKYEEALKYIDKYSVKDEIIGAGARSLKGDCLVNLDRLDEAAGAFKDAISTSDNNPAYTPFFMMKLARVYAAQNKHNEEAKIYEEIVKNYPLYGQAHNIDVEKLLDRARLQAGK